VVVADKAATGDIVKVMDDAVRGAKPEPRRRRR
jgi:hypothetical protein